MKEAERFVDASLQNKKPGTVLLLGPGENYITTVLAARYPWAAIYSIHPDGQFCKPGLDQATAWWPQAGLTLRNFLRRCLFNEQASAGVAVLEWEPVMATYPQMAAQIRNEVTKSLASAAADRATVTYWAASWLKNCLHFARRLRQATSLSQQSGGIILAAAGPGLNDCLPAIRRSRDQATVWALSSAVPALLTAGIRPDFVISTDPGYWSGVHLQSSRQQGLLVGLPPSAYAGTGLLDSGRPIVPLDTGLLFEKTVLQQLGITAVPAIAFGTAAGTALNLALTASTGPIAVCGLDFAAYQTRTHAKPYAFDNLHLEHASRLHPGQASLYGETIERYPEKAGSWRFSRAFSAYANELTIAPSDLGRVFRFSRSPVTSAGMASFPVCHFENLDWPENSPPESPEIKSVSGGADKVVGILDALGRQAGLAIDQALVSGKAFAFDDALVLKALGGAAVAAPLALAARGQLTSQTALQAREAIRQALEKWSEPCR
ncbi:MAG: hypothetical protein A2004_14085 [Spirochaetes bacterium GWC1_61_12]|nr:MAG: hypothetical protein A2Y37_12220 [Spirochaetes bacterium GWB1_60_80]OHD30139.1 MAG: hypothetical protein A2004_14085 [Spirochaetes bacterium GWC1_61_12]